VFCVAVDVNVYSSMFESALEILQEWGKSDQGNASLVNESWFNSNRKERSRKVTGGRESTKLGRDLTSILVPFQ
jgi:hypothetical protein